MAPSAPAGSDPEQNAELRRARLVLALQDRLHGVSDPDELQYLAAGLVVESLGADRAGYAQDQGDGETVAVTRDFVNGVPSLRGTYRYADYGPELLARLCAGERVVRPDIAADPSLTAEERAAHAHLGLGATVNVPLVRHGQLRAIFFVHTRDARQWQDDELALISDVAARTWDAVERAQVASQLRASEGRYRALVDQLPGAAVFVFDRQLRYLAAAGEALAKAGFNAGDFVGKTLQEALPPDLVAEYEPRYRQALAGVPFEVEHEAHGHVYRSRGVPLRNGDAVVSAVLVASYDITAQRRIEEMLRANERELRDSAERYRTIFESLEVAVWEEDFSQVAEDLAELRRAGVTDLRAFFDSDPPRAYELGARIRLLDANACAERMFEADDKTALLRSVASYFEPAGASSAIDCLLAIDRGDRRFSAETVYRTLKGRRFPARFTMSVMSSDRPYQRVLVVIEDLTAPQQAEHDLRRYAAKLQVLDQRKNEFLATLAHELRNPLAPIRNGLLLLRLQRDARAAAERTLAMMDRQLSHLVRLVDDLLDVGRISAGKLELRLQQVKLADVLASSVEATRELIQARSHTLELDYGAGDRWINGDVDRLTQVFSNLLINAAKFTPMGGRISLQLRHDATHDVVTVQDSGVGIDPQDLPHVFDLFSQVRARQGLANNGGLGIGLSIVSRLIEMHGGTVSADSAGLGSGSRFTVRLPVAAGEARVGNAPRPGAWEAPERPLQVLVVDDNVDAATSMAEVLRLIGHEVAVAHDGLAAVARTLATQPDVVLLDLGMPGIDGLEAARRIRTAQTGKRSRLIALTGWGQPEDRRRTREAGFDEHLVKPIESAALIEALRRL